MKIGAPDVKNHEESESEIKSPRFNSLVAPQGGRRIFRPTPRAFRHAPVVSSISRSLARKLLGEVLPGAMSRPFEGARKPSAPAHVSAPDPYTGTNELSGALFARRQARAPPLMTVNKISLPRFLPPSIICSEGLSSASLQLRCSLTLPQ